MAPFGAKSRLIWSAVMFCVLLLASSVLAQVAAAPHPQSQATSQQVGQERSSPNTSEATNSSSERGGPAATREQVPRWLQILKTTGEVLAYVLAFLFFLLKAYEGYLTSNLSLRLTCRRGSAKHRGASSGKDQIAVVVALKKGENGMLKLFMAECRLQELNSGLEHRQTFDIKRIGYKREDVINQRTNALKWNTVREGWPFLQFPPGDEAQFAGLFEVTSGEPCKIDIVVMGRSRWPKTKLSQWRASEISLPSEAESRSQA